MKMKTKQLLLTFALLLTAGINVAWADEVEVLTATLGGWTRTTDNHKDYSAGSYELKHYTYTETSTDYDYYGLMKFAIPSKEGMRIKSLSLRLVTKKKSYAPGEVTVYRLDEEITTSKGATELASAIAGAIELASFDTKYGEINKMIGTDGLSNAENGDLSKWTNTINLPITDISSGENLNLLLAMTGDRINDGNEGGSNPIIFFSNNAGDIDAKANSEAHTSSELVPQLTVTYEAVQSSSIGSSDGDCWVRTDTPSANCNDGAFEIKNFSDSFYGLMSFEFTAPETDTEVSSAILRLTTRYRKGDAGMEIYAMDYIESTDNKKYSDVSEAITTALSKTPIAIVSLKGYSDKAIFDNGISAEYQNVEAWQNTIDLSSYVRSLSTNKFTLLFKKSKYQSTSSQVYTKDATDAKWDESLGTSVAGTTIPAASLKPQLTVTYKDAKHTSVDLPIADTWINKGGTTERSGAKSMEIYTNGETDYMGLMSFQLPTYATSKAYKVKSATLRLVTKRLKESEAKVNLYALGTGFAENTIYSSIESAVTTAYGSSYIAQFTVAGQNNCDVEVDAVDEGKRNAASWTNYIDLTDYVKGLSGSQVNILIRANNTSSSAQKMFFTKEATGFTNTKVDGGNFTISTSELVPQLTIVYEKESYDLTVSSYEASTLVLPFDAELPTGVSAYTLNYTAGNSSVKATSVDAITANQPVLINATKGTYTFKSNGTTNNNSPVEGALTGVYEKTDVPADSYILWANATHPIGFYKAKNSTVAANRAYLTADGAGVKEALMIDLDGLATGLESLTPNPSPVGEGSIFNLAGQRLSRMQKGINIVNGKKVLVK